CWLMVSATGSQYFDFW
nr:immunoglobulin heavy chain junction region [Macaca mulatta]MOW78705.1 immunoglobulin heavy chain junction region [Macaca mulatta]MOW81156.1 immunoglobulin heavy chain junction region [Macaca mulatta]MOW81946.1 immunoglobulin heavy chain junction region [Macaca mulatta]MOW82104.1 immunoglobulin heavy chain junction region [Macaca mulatta]